MSSFSEVPESQISQGVVGDGSVVDLSLDRFGKISLEDIMGKMDEVVIQLKRLAAILEEANGVYVSEDDVSEN